MTDTTANDWSPADNPYAIAVSEAQWWRAAARLAILRMRRDDDNRFGWFSPRQIDARNLILALRQLLRAERLEQAALEALNIDRSVREELGRAAKRFTDDLPGIEEMRDGLTHFDDWSRGLGAGPQKTHRKLGHAPRDVAREFWRFGYDPGAGTVSFGPYAIDVDVAEQAARELCSAIYLAAHAVDEKNTVALRVRTVAALTTAGVYCDVGEPGVKVSPGQDRKVGLSAWMWVIRGIRVGESAAHDGYRAAVRAAAICAHLAGHAKGPSRGGGAEAGHVWPADP